MHLEVMDDVHRLVSRIHEVQLHANRKLAPSCRRGEIRCAGQVTVKWMPDGKWSVYLFA